MSAWRVEESERHRGLIEVVGTALTAVNGFTVATNVSEERARQMRKDAALIAAAPELLDLLIRAQEELRLIRMKDCAAVYDTTVRTEINIALAKVAAP